MFRKEGMNQLPYMRKDLSTVRHPTLDLCVFVWKVYELSCEGLDMF